MSVVVVDRERELLCPILEEDNESTASGSVLNLQTGTQRRITAFETFLIYGA